MPQHQILDKNSVQKRTLLEMLLCNRKKRDNPWFCFSVPDAAIKTGTPEGAGTGQLRGRGTGLPSPLPSCKSQSSLLLLF